MKPHPDMRRKASDSSGAVAQRNRTASLAAGCVTASSLSMGGVG